MIPVRKVYFQFCSLVFGLQLVGLVPKDTSKAMNLKASLSKK